MANLAPYNRLPPKPEYINKIIAMLSKHPESRPIDMERKTRLTKTQVMCTLEQLLREKKVILASQNPKTYSLNQTE